MDFIARANFRFGSLKKTHKHIPYLSLTTCQASSKMKENSTKIYYLVEEELRKSLDQIQKEHGLGFKENNFISITSAYKSFLPFGQLGVPKEGPTLLGTY